MPKSQYPADYNPPKPWGRCEVCGCETKAYAKKWQARCPQHWQELDKHNRIGRALAAAK